MECKDEDDKKYWLRGKAELIETLWKFNHPPQGGTPMLSIYPTCFIKENLDTCGNDLEEAFSMEIDCLVGYIYSAEKEGEEIPKASFVAVDVEEYAKMHFNKNLKEKEGGL